MKLKDLKKEKKAILFARVNESTKKRLLDAAKTSGYHSNQVGQFLEKLIKTALGVLILVSCTKQKKVETLYFNQVSSTMYSVCSPEVEKCVYCKLSYSTRDEAWNICRDNFEKLIAKVPEHYK